MPVTCEWCESENNVAAVTLKLAAIEDERGTVYAYDDAYLCEDCRAKAINEGHELN